jgi:hypothetical protein
VDVSRDLVAGGVAVSSNADTFDEALRGLVAFHVDFAISNPDVIVVQDRDLGSLQSDDRDLVRSLQRGYIEAWVGVLGDIHPATPIAVVRIRARATFGLISSIASGVHGARCADLRIACST